MELIAHIVIDLPKEFDMDASDVEVALLDYLYARYEDMPKIKEMSVSVYTVSSKV